MKNKTVHDARTCFWTGCKAALNQLKKIIRPWLLINLFWRIKIKRLFLFSQKIKIGFGPIATGENDLSVRKWRIDPIIDEINRTSDQYVAGFFIDPKEMKKFDRTIIVKKFTADFIPIIKHLKKRRFIYDIVDNPNCSKEEGSYLDSPEFTGLMDGFILSSPLHKRSLRSYSKPSLLIEHPIINSSYKTDYSPGKEIILLAQGYYENLKNLTLIEPLLPEISQEIGKKIVLVYHSEMVLPQTEWTRHIKWTAKNCFPVMSQADIAVTIKELHKIHQKTKPSTKVIAYMAAGLPVVCFPSITDRLVISHGINGFFAYTKKDWKHWIEKLALSARLRRQIGRAARKSVIDCYSVANITKKYIQLLDLL